MKVLLRAPAKCAAFCLFLAPLLLLCSGFAQTPPPAAANFQFNDADLKLLQEVNEFDRQLSSKGLVMKDPELNAYVQRIGEKLLGNQPPPERVEFKFRVLRDPTINAFALPNGSIYVHTGLLALLNNEGELASVLAHEITHVTNRHSYLENRSYRKKMVMIDIFQAAAAASGYFPAGSVVGLAVGMAGTLGQFMTVMTIFGYSQEMEREADHNGIERLYKAGYDPHAMPRSFELLDERLEYEPVEGFYRDHPKLKERQRYSQEMAETLGGRDLKTGTEDDYLINTVPAICYNIRADQQARRERTALARSKKLTAWQPNEPNYLVLEADSYRLLGAKTATPSPEELEKHGQAEHKKRYFKMTEEEEQRDLLAKNGGGDQRAANYTSAEKHYLKALDVDPKYPEAHRGLGFLYQQEGKKSDAIHEYQSYLDVAPAEAPDRLRVKLRLKTLEPGGADISKEASNLKSGSKDRPTQPSAAVEPAGTTSAAATAEVGSNHEPVTPDQSSGATKTVNDAPPVRQLPTVKPTSQTEQDH